jgi:hypothetical protein
LVTINRFEQQLLYIEVSSFDESVGMRIVSADARICRRWYCFARYSTAAMKMGLLLVMISERELQQQVMSSNIQLPRVIADSERSF